MIKMILFGLCMGLIGMICGFILCKDNIKMLNKSFRIPKDLPTTFDDFKQEIESYKFCNISNILDIAFNYGYNEKQEQISKIENKKIDEMLVILSGETETKF